MSLSRRLAVGATMLLYGVLFANAFGVAGIVRGSSLTASFWAVFSTGTLMYALPLAVVARIFDWRSGPQIASYVYAALVTAFCLLSWHARLDADKLGVFLLGAVGLVSGSSGAAIAVAGRNRMIVSGMSPRAIEATIFCTTLILALLPVLVLTGKK